MKCIFRKMDRDFSNTISVQELRFLCKDNADFMFHRFDDDEHHELGMKELKRIINTNELAIEALAKLNSNCIFVFSFSVTAKITATYREGQEYYTSKKKHFRV